MQYICDERATKCLPKKAVAQRVAAQIQPDFVTGLVEYRCGYTPAPVSRPARFWSRKFTTF